MDWFLYWHTQVHSVSETSCSKSPTFHVCAVIFRATCLRVRLLKYPTKPFCKTCIHRVLKLKVPCSGRCCPSPPCEPEPWRPRPLGTITSLIRDTEWCILCSLASPKTHSIQYIPTFASLDRFCTVTSWYTIYATWYSYIGIVDVYSKDSIAT